MEILICWLPLCVQVYHQCWLQVHFLSVAALVWLWNRLDLQWQMKQATTALLVYACYRHLLYQSVSLSQWSTIYILGVHFKFLQAAGTSRLNGIVVVAACRSCTHGISSNFYTRHLWQLAKQREFQMTIGILQRSLVKLDILFAPKDPTVLLFSVARACFVFSATFVKIVKAKDTQMNVFLRGKIISVQR